MNTLNPRRKKILCAIIQSYIDYNIPIGSYFITKKFPVGLSPATIRNTMALLEGMGYITQPHTSAGRIPTEKGYRFYVDTLLEERKLTLNAELSSELSNIFSIPEKDSSRILNEAIKTLSLYSHCLAIAIPPKMEDTILRRIKFIKYEMNKILTILISENGMVINKIIELERSYSQKQLDKASNILNDKFSGRSIKAVREIIAEQLYNDGMICDQLILNLLSICRDSIVNESESLAFNSLAGTANLPDFVTMKQIKKILEAIEDKQFMLKLLNHISNFKETEVFVGMENIVPALTELSMVISTFKNQQSARGAIGIIGPTRMNYRKLIPMVEYTAETLTKIMSTG